jgi:lysophospholipase L1-like esterase
MINWMGKKFFRRGILLLLVLALGASVAANFVLYRQAMQSYVELQQLRLDPDDAKRFEASNRQLPSPAAGQKRVVLFGDSRIAMWRPLPNVAGCQIINRGVGSETTDQLLRRVERDVIGLHPDAVVIEMGINDLKNIGLFPASEQEIVNSCNRNTDLMLDGLRRNGTSVIVLTIFPVGPVPLTRRSIWSDKTLDAVGEYNRRMKGLALPGVIVVDCDPALSIGGRMNPKYALDTLHMTDAGYAALNSQLEPILKQVLLK